MFVSEGIKFGISRLVEKYNDSRSTYNVTYAAVNNNNNNITKKSLNEPAAEDEHDERAGEAARNRCAREAAARKIWSPLRSPRSSPASSSSDLDVESRLGTSPDIDVTKCSTPPPAPSQPSLPAAVVQFASKPPTAAKNSEAFSVSALLKPDAPRSRLHPYNHHHHHHHHEQQQQQQQQSAMTETVSVTRSLLYPAVQFPDLIKDTRKEAHLHPAAASTLLQKHFSGFSFHPHFYSAATNMLNPSGSPEHGADAHTDSNHNLLTSSLYLSLSAVQAATAAAAFVHPLSATGN